MSSLETLLSQALQYHQSGQLQEAEQLLLKLVRREPQHGRALSLLGVISQQQNQHTEALNYYHRAVENGMASAPLLSNMGAASRELEQHHNALAYYQKAVELDERYAPAHFNSGVLNSKEGQFDKARKSFEETLRYEPNFADAHNNLANILQKLGDFAGMHRHQCRAIELEPENADFNANLGRSLYEQKKYEEALECFESAARFAPQNAGYQMDLGVCYREMGNYQAAFKSYQQAVKLAPTSLNAHFSAGVMAILIKQYGIAADCFKEALKIVPNHADTMLHLGKAQLGQEHFTEAVESFEQAIRLNPELTTAYFNLGTTLYQLQEFDKSIVNLQRAVTLEPTSVAIRKSLCKALQHQNRLKEAIDSYLQLCQLQPNDPDPLLQLGSCQLNVGELAGARQTFNQVLQLNPQHKMAWNNLGNAWNREGKAEESIECYRKVLQIDPQFTPAHNNLAEIYRNIGLIEESRKHYLLSKNGTNDNRVELQQSVLLPPIYNTHEELPVYRKQLEENLDRLSSAGCTVDPTREIVPPLFYLAYQGLPDRPIHEKFCSLLVPSPKFQACPRIPKNRADGKIRVGFLSHHFKNHTIGHLMNGIVSELSRDQFHVTVLTQTAQNDKLGQVFQKAADDYIVLSSNLERAITHIQNQDLDILYYPDLGMDPYTLTLSQLRLAPVQCVSWGHPVTTGCKEIDYYVTSELIETDAEAQAHYTEKLIRFKTINVYYQPVVVPQQFATRADLNLPENANLYICPQSLFKFHPDIDQVFGGILEQDPEGLIVLIDGPTKEWKQKLEERFARTIPDQQEQIHFVPRLSHNDFMSLMYLADVMIDPLHFGGGNTTYQALALGLPVVSLPSEYQRGRITQGLYHKMEMMDCVVDSVEAYIELSVELGTNREKRAEMSKKIKANNSKLFQDRSAIVEYEQFFLEAVNAAQIQDSSGTLRESA